MSRPTTSGHHTSVEDRRRRILYLSLYTHVAHKHVPAYICIHTYICAQRSKGKRRNANQPNSANTKKTKKRNTKKSKAQMQTNIYYEDTENDGTQTSPTHDKHQQQKISTMSYAHNEAKGNDGTQTSPTHDAKRKNKKRPTQHEKIKSKNANKYLCAQRRNGKRRNANQPNSR